jgi:hypothetical protein
MCASWKTIIFLFIARTGKFLRLKVLWVCTNSSSSNCSKTAGENTDHFSYYKPAAAACCWLVSKRSVCALRCGNTHVRALATVLLLQRDIGTTGFAVSNKNYHVFSKWWRILLIKATQTQRSVMTISG